MKTEIVEKKLLVFIFVTFNVYNAWLENIFAFMTIFIKFNKNSILNLSTIFIISVPALSAKCKRKHFVIFMATLGGGVVVVTALNVPKIFEI